MGTVLGIDVAWERPTVAQIQATGAHWVARYFSPDASKNLTAAEVQSYPAAGLSIVTVYESTAARATAGFAAGVADAQLAEAERRAVGLPSSHVHYFAVDEDTSWASVQPYFDGVVSVLGWDRVGCYGGYPVVVGAHGHAVRYLWQTVAWSGGQWAGFADIRQTGGTLLGGSADIDYAQDADFGQTPRPAPPTPPAPEDDFMALFANVDEFKAAVMAASIAALESQPGRDAEANAAMWWWDHVLNGTTTPGMSPAQKALIMDMHGAMLKLAQTPPVSAPVKK